MPGGGGSPQPAGNTTTTSTTAPWSGQQPYLTAGFQQAQNLFNQGGPQYYPGQTYAGETPQQGQAINMASSLATTGDPSVNAAEGALTNVENGSYLSAGNPYFQQMMQGVASAVTPQVTGGFEANGRYGSGAMDNALTSALTQEGGNLAFQNYSQGMNNMLQGAMLAPGLENAGFTNAQQLSNAGSEQQSLDQAGINDQVQRYNYNQNLPWNTLANYMGMVNGNYGQSATQTSPYFGPSSSSNALGGALGGAALGSAIMPGIGTIGGGVLGALLGGL